MRLILLLLTISHRFIAYSMLGTIPIYRQCLDGISNNNTIWFTDGICSLSLSQPTLFLKSVACLSRCKCFSSFFYSFAAKSKNLHSLIRLLLFSSVFASFILKAQCLGSQNHSFKHEICKIFIRPFQWIKNISQMHWPMWGWTPEKWIWTMG